MIGRTPVDLGIDSQIIDIAEATVSPMGQNPSRHFALIAGRKSSLPAG